MYTPYLRPLEIFWGAKVLGSMKSRCLRFVVAWIQISQLPQNPRSQQKDSKLTTTHDAERLGSYRTFLTKDVLIKVGFQRNIFIMIGTREPQLSSSRQIYARLQKQRFVQGDACDSKMVPQIMNYHHTPYSITMQHLQNQQAICLAENQLPVVVVDASDAQCSLCSVKLEK